MPTEPNGSIVPVRVSMLNGRSRLASSTITTFPSDIGPNQFLMIFSRYEYKKPGTVQLNSIQNLSGTSESVLPTSSNAIVLPIPTNLQDQNEARIGRFDSNYIGEKLARSAAHIAENGNNTNASDLLNSTLSNITSGEGAKIANAIQNGNYASLLKDSAYLMKTFNTTVGKAISVGAGVVANPKASLAYDGHELKNHSFTWNFAPRSPEESVNLRNIINFIKHNQLPTTGGGVDSMLYLNYPCVVDIYFIGIDENFFYKFKTCMIRSFNVNYSGQNAVSILRGGRPSSINMEMNLMEMDIHYGDEYADNGIGNINYDIPVSTVVNPRMEN